MAWQRKTPFGYEMRNGQIQICPDEADAIEFIYDAYRQGESFLKIATAMSELGIRYHQTTPEWNKNMVKRILENKKYIGCEGFPVIIAENIWQDVQEIRFDKTARYTRQSLCTEMVKRKIMCGECGATFSKETAINTSGTRWWHCSNPECTCSMKMKDDALEETISGLMGRLFTAPELLDYAECEDAPPAPEAVKIQNEIHRELGRPEFDEEYLITLIFACAAEKYAALSDRSDQRRAAGIKSLLHSRAAQTTFDAELFESAVYSLLITAGNTISLQLISGNILT